VPYAYTLNFVDPGGIIPPQRFVARPADLATVAERYVQDVRSTAGWITLGGTPGELNAHVPVGGAVIPLRLPGSQVEYLSAKPATLWQSEYLEYRAVFPGHTAGGQTAPFRLYRAGQHLTRTWNQYPLHPGTNVALPGTRAILVRSSADRAGNTINLDLTPFSDNQGHEGSGLGIEIPGTVDHVSGSFALYQNGKKIAGGNAVTATGGYGDLHVSAALSPKPSLITFVVGASRAGKQYPLSAVSRDIWTWRSRPEPGATVPAPWLCDLAAVPPSADRHCAVQPLLTLNYQVTGLTAGGTARPGRQAITITAGHIQLAPSPGVTRASQAVSFDGGKTWHPARVARLPGGRFRAVFTAPPDALVTLRTSAADAAGGSITETITGAYRTAPASR
jgi:hypothetical protein